ncbi:response regulator [Roseomonas harenae]|uniref:response regulator n=1 Tax=Muricoccus harenae TaxID=2692566 RepID=UPI0013319565|nr:response regulator [Roseomonas harenae]
MTKILLVEDTEDIRDFLARRLRRRGFEVELAQDGEAGVKAARDRCPEIILLDMSMPVKDGWTAAREMRADPATASIPIIALTAHALAGDQEKSLAAGCNDYHPKPVELPRLLEQIETLLVRRGRAKS